MTVQANKSRQATESLLSEHKQLMESLSMATNSSSSALEEGLEQQKIMDELLSAVNESRRAADNAVSDAERTLSEAEQTLNTLRGDLQLYRRAVLQSCQFVSAFY